MTQVEAQKQQQERREGNRRLKDLGPKGHSPNGTERRKQERRDDYAIVLTQARERAGMTQLELAGKSDVDNSMVSKYERALNLPSRERVILFADLLNADRMEALQAAGYESRPESDTAPGHRMPTGDNHLHLIPSPDLETTLLKDVATKDDIEQLRKQQAFLERQIADLRSTAVAILNSLQPKKTEDKLTGLKNYRAFRQRLQKEFQQSREFEKNKFLSLLLVDIDRLAQFNAQYGQEAGDRVIVKLAELLRKQARESDLVARLLADELGDGDWARRYGDQFAILLPKTNAGEVAAFAEECKKRVETHRWEYEQITVTVSHATTTEDMIVSEELLIQASKALDNQRVGLDWMLDRRVAQPK